MVWQAYTYAPGVTITPDHGRSSPGEVVDVTIRTTGGSLMYPTWFIVLTADPAHPRLWGQQWIASITIN